MKDILKNVLIITLSVLVIYLFQTTMNNELRIVKLEEAIIELHFRISDIKIREYRKMFWTDTVVITNYAESGQKPKTITITNFINRETEE